MKKWTRSKDKMLGGVLGGFAKYTDTDPTLIRIIYLLLWLSPTVVSLGLIYIVLWILLPEETTSEE
tara:strand:- start:92704 stop:92901 length:198 start_codon:yes stop_codon:yes gene_type:complete